LQNSSSQNYQAQVTGFPHGYEYTLKYLGSVTRNKVVDFDGFEIRKVDGIDFGIFIEAKGSEYEKLLRYGFNHILDEMIVQATRQVEAIIENGAHVDLTKVKPLEWRFAEQYTLRKFEMFLLDNPVTLSNGKQLSDYIKLIHTRPIP
jgi:hypothetical protein